MIDDWNLHNDVSETAVPVMTHKKKHFSWHLPYLTFSYFPMFNAGNPQHTTLPSMPCFPPGYDPPPLDPLRHHIRHVWLFRRLRPTLQCWPAASGGVNLGLAKIRSARRCTTCVLTCLYILKFGLKTSCSMIGSKTSGRSLIRHDLHLQPVNQPIPTVTVFIVTRA